MRWVVIAMGFVLGPMGQPSAQIPCRPPASSNEAKVLANFSVPLAFAPLGGPTPVRPDSLRLTLEGSYLPTLDAATRTPTVCRPGKGNAGSRAPIWNRGPGLRRARRRRDRPGPLSYAWR